MDSVGHPLVSGRDRARVGTDSRAHFFVEGAKPLRRGRCDRAFRRSRDPGERHRHLRRRGQHPTAFLEIVDRVLDGLLEHSIGEVQRTCVAQPVRLDDDRDRYAQRASTLDRRPDRLTEVCAGMGGRPIHYARLEAGRGARHRGSVGRSVAPRGGIVERRVLHQPSRRSASALHQEYRGGSLGLRSRSDRVDRALL